MKSVSVIKPRSNELQSDPMIEDSKGLPMPKSRLRSLLGGVYMEAVFKEEGVRVLVAVKLLVSTSPRPRWLRKSELLRSTAGICISRRSLIPMRSGPVNSCLMAGAMMTPDEKEVESTVET